MTFVIDLDAARREVQYPNGIPVLLFDEQWLFPAEIPADALDPLLDEELDLAGLLGELVNSTAASAAGEVLELLFKRPALPKKFFDAIKETYALLLGEQYEQFKQNRPYIGDYVRLTKALIPVYGVDLGKLFGLGSSSETDGETSSPTSAATTSSTPEESGSAPHNAASSD
ncbi:hypothetical protein [Streptomyces longispororuber]|uniref:hypothetical protein n=1 Tax=Streptomyces longispororuber TaxID=68230 RepID=UPI0036FC9747